MTKHELHRMVSPKEVSKILDYSEGTIKNKCASGELLCAKVGRQWVLDRNYLEKTRKVEVWESWKLFLSHEDDTTDGGLFILSDEVFECVLPVINKELYFKINYEELKENYGDEVDIDDGEVFSIDHVDWEKESVEYDLDDEDYIALSDFTDEYAKSNGYYTLSEFDYLIQRVWQYLDSRMNYKSVYSEQMENMPTYIITDDGVSLDEWNGHNFETGGTGLHQHAYKILKHDDEILDEDIFMIVETSDWRGANATVKGIYSLEGTLEYISELHENPTFTTQKYKEMLTEL